MKKFTLIFVFFFVGQIWSQIELIGPTITKQKLKKHIEILASDSMGGREVGEAGETMAANYMSNHFRNIGVKPYNDVTYIQEIPLEKIKINDASLRIGNENFVYGKDFYTYPKFKNQNINARELVFLGYGIHSDTYSDYIQDVSGKVIVISVGEPKKEDGSYIISNSDKKSPHSGWRYKLSVAKKRGAKAVVFVSSDYNSEYIKSKHKIEEPGVNLISKSEQIPFLFVRKSVIKKVLGKNKFKKYLSQIQNNGNLKSKMLKTDFLFKLSTQTNNFYGKNILALIEGSDSILKNEIVVITAHYDHLGIVDGVIHNGADDNATGTAALLEIASAFQKAKKEGAEFKRSILFFPNSAEEKGLLGSYYYVENPAYPIENTVACLNIDMIGRTDRFHSNDSNYIYLIGSDKLSTDLHNVSEQSNNKYVKMNIDYTFNSPGDPNRFYYRSDHYNFAKKNIPSIFYFSGVHEDYHKESDTVEKIIYEKVEKTARLVFYTAWEIANMKTRPKVDKLNEFQLNRY